MRTTGLRTTDLTTTRVRSVAPAEHDDVARLLARAFADDPIFAWCIPDRIALHAALPGFFAAFVEAFARHEQIQAIEVDGTIVGATLWAPPGVAGVHDDDAERLGERLGAACGEWIERVGIVSETFEAAHPHEPAWFLQFVGIDALNQGNGLGSRLIRPVLSVADRHDEPAYLVATSPRNRAHYERLGFRSIADLTLPDGPTAYAMWREPVTR